MPEVSAVVLAAGLSTRMGGPNKLLLPWGCSTVVGSVISALRKCEVEIIVVTGRDADEVAQAVDPVRTVFNENFEQGMGTSIATGVKNCEEGRAFLITLGDMPELDSAVIKELIQNLNNPSDIVAPIYADEPNRPGHPVLFGSDYRDALTALKGDKGANEIIASNKQHLRRVECAGSLKDIDTPSDL